MHDELWHRMLSLEMNAHHQLARQQQTVAQNEYFAGRRKRRLPVRACLAQYVILDICATTHRERDLSPEFQIEIANTEALRAALFRQQRRRGTGAL